MTVKNKVFSGVQPTGNLHLGIYLGALKNFVALQNKMVVFIVQQLIACNNSFQDPKKLKENILETAASFLAAGIDENKSMIFSQSAIGSLRISLDT